MKITLGAIKQIGFKQMFITTSGQYARFNIAFITFEHDGYGISPSEYESVFSTLYRLYTLNNRNSLVYLKYFEEIYYLYVNL